jgi:signal transduction histidine kinase
LQPIAKVVNEVDEISISNLNFRLDEGNGQDEISKLAQTFNDMLSRLETSFLSQRNFISNASHELRTPLTSITGQLEVILLNTRSPQEYKSVMYSVLEDIKNLNILSNRLLLLAQATSAERVQRMTQLRIDELVWQAKEEVSKHYPDFIINIDMDGNLDDDHKLIIHGDEQLVKTAFINLFENGCKYSQNRTTNVFIKSRDAGVEIMVHDNGIGIPKEELASIFEPFFRGSNAGNIKGHGIGLSMVSGILRLHNAGISINSGINEGTEVKINFPTVQIA